MQISREQINRTASLACLKLSPDEVSRYVCELGQILDYLGYEVLEAENGETTLEKYKAAQSDEDPIDLIIMDLTIPGGMGGKETIKELQKVDPEVRAIVSSGYSNDPIMANYNDYGFIGVLNKPYNVETLSDALSQFFNNNSST